MPRVRIFPLLIFILLSFFPSVYGKSELSVEWITEPPFPKIVPDQSVVKSTLRVKDQTGNLVPNVYLKMKMHAPQGHTFISTDFPIVEKTQLMEYAGVLPQGVWTFDYIYPIRGVYRIEVEAQKDPLSAIHQSVMMMKVNENPAEKRNLLILLGLLFGFGIWAGFIIGRGDQARRAVSIMVVVISISIAGFGFMTGDVAAGHDAHGKNLKGPLTETVTNGNVVLEFLMDPGQGRVGTLNRLTLRALDLKGRLIPNTAFAVKIWHQEDDKPVFATEMTSLSGEFQWGYQFFDGAEHEVRVMVDNALGHAQLQQVVGVEGIHPPLPIKVRTIFYFLAIVGLGNILGVKASRMRS